MQDRTRVLEAGKFLLATVLLELKLVSGYYFLILFPFQINVEKLAASLPLHLIATLLSPDRDMRMGHVLRGIRLLYTLSDLATRHARLEQVFISLNSLSILS